MFELNGKYTNAIIYTDMIEQEAIAQIIELCNQPMFEGSTIRIMPDCHSGKGCVIGFTAKLSKKMIVPNLVGVDIGCGVLTTVFKAETPIDFKELDTFIRNNIPSGFSVRSKPSDKLKNKVRGKSWGTHEDVVRLVCKHINEDDNKINYHLASVGSLGGGNHYIEVGQIDETTFALSVHTGSRNLGKQVCDYYQKNASVESKSIRDAITAKHKTAVTAEEHEAIQRELSSLPKVPKDLAYIEDSLYESYVEDMLYCKAIAALNRMVISDEIMEYLTSFGARVERSFDTVHNYIEKVVDVIVVRKGAIAAYKGEEVAIPLNMRDGVIIGVGKGNADWNCSAPHGAGRLMSRSKAKETLSLEDFKNSMKGINSWSIGSSTIDESPMAYKPAESIINAIKDTVDIKAIIKPVYNFKASE